MNRTKWCLFGNLAFGVAALFTWTTFMTNNTPIIYPLVFNGIQAMFVIAQMIDWQIRAGHISKIKSKVNIFFGINQKIEQNF